MASTGRAPNDPREVRRRRLEAERLQKQAESASPQANAVAEQAPAAQAATTPAPATDDHVKPVKEVVTAHGEELEESKEHKPS
jgi:ribonuclease E